VNTSNAQNNLDAVKFRAQALTRIRDFFAARNVLEVETPLLSQGASHDCHIDIFPVIVDSNASLRYLQSSPEPHMKRLLARGYPDIFQICKAFRLEEQGRIHNPEFTLLEWYRKGFSLRKMMEETVELCLLVAGSRPVVYATYSEVFLQATGLDPFSATREQLLTQSAIAKSGLDADHFSEIGDLLNFLMSEVVEPSFDPKALTVIHEFPLRLSSQALPSPSFPGAALRFEIFCGGMELGNGYEELRDPFEYRVRFEAENQKRQNAGKPFIPLQQAWFSDMESGLPPCSGMAIGLDRLILLGLGITDFAALLEFPWKNA